MNDFNPLEFIKNIFVAGMIGMLCVLAWFLYQSTMLPLIASGTMNVTAWSPLVAQIPTVGMPFVILGVGIFLIYVLFFKPKLPDNPFYTQAKQQYSAQQRLQREINRNKPKNTVRPM